MMDIVVARVQDFDSYAVQKLEFDIKLAKSRNQKVLPVMINSPGGYVLNLLQMIDMLDASGLKIITILNGIGASCGAILFASGQERYMSKNSTLMIHAISGMAYGENEDVRAQADRMDMLNNKLFAILDNAGKKPVGHFLNLYNSDKKRVDWFLSSEEAKELGLVTEIRIPDPEELINKANLSVFTQRSEIQRYQMLMSLSNKNEISQKIIPKKGERMDLELLMSQLDEEQKKPITSLQASIGVLQKTISDKESEIQRITTDKDKEINELKTKMDKNYIDGLIQNMKLPKSEETATIEILNSLSGKSKESYKSQLESRTLSIKSEIPDNGENKEDLSKNKKEGSDLLDEMKAYAEKNKIDIKTVDGYQKAYLGYMKSKK